MIDNRYLVFVSSTFRDLQEERRAVSSAILELNWFPSGMETFPASNSTPWALIERMIRDADYYVLIIGGMYGSTDDAGISYTEKEYDYALSKGIPVLAFLPENPGNIPTGKAEMEAKVRKKLERFQTKVKRHHCKYWEGPEDLKAKVLVSLVKESLANPRPGWVRRDEQDSAQTLKKLTDALEENIALKSELARLQVKVDDEVPSDLARGGDLFEIRWSDIYAPTVEISWEAIWHLLCRVVISETTQNHTQHQLSLTLVHYLAQVTQSAIYANLNISDESFEEMVFQFIALGYMEPVTMVKQSSGGGISKNPSVRTSHLLGYRATKRGVLALSQSRAIRRSKSEA